MSLRLGMYIHMHWGYGHPYAARTWTFDDWHSYASGLAALGYDLIMIWPILETMPDPPTASDVAHLEKLAAVIDMLHDEFGMTVLITAGAITVGNDKAADYSFEERPFFKTDLRLDPSDGNAVDMLMRVRRTLYGYLKNADGMVIIDSDPGGYAGSTNAEFTMLLRRHMGMIADVNADAHLYYWLWAGWESYNAFWDNLEKTGETALTENLADCESVVSDLLEWPDDRCKLLVCNREQQELAARLGVLGRSIYFPYGAVEGEPTFPLTNCSPPDIEAAIGGYPWGHPYMGSMANSQTHVAQLPGAYLFAHFAGGGTEGTVDLPGFAGELVPGAGDAIADAWAAIGENDGVRAREIAARVVTVRERLDADCGARPGKYSGLLMGDPVRFLRDIEMQLAFSADMSDFADAAGNERDSRTELAALIASWSAWMGRTGFVDAYLGPVEARLHGALRTLSDARIDAVLDDFDDWRDPAVRNGIVPRLLTALKDHSG